MVGNNDSVPVEELPRQQELLNRNPISWLALAG